MSPDARSAEMTKLVENAYRDVNIGLANQFATFAATQGGEQAVTAGTLGAGDYLKSELGAKIEHHPADAEPRTRSHPTGDQVVPSSWRATASRSSSCTSSSRPTSRPAVASRAPTC